VDPAPASPDGPPERPIRVLRHNDPARRVACSFAIFNGAELATWIALMVYAFEQGGATESGVVALVQLVPAGLLAPLAGGLAERNRPERVLAIGYGVQSGALALAALTLALDGPAPLVYAFVGVMTVAITTTRPAQALVTPRLARTVDELTALNVVAEWATQGAVFIAPVITAVLLGLMGPELVFGAFAASLVVAAIAVPRVPAGVTHPARGQAPRSRLFATARAELHAALRTAFREPAVRLVLVISAAGFVVVGALDVLTIVLAIDQLGGSPSTAAWLSAALGAGGVIGSATGGALVGRRLAPALVLAAAVFGAGLIVIGVVPTRMVAYLMLLGAGTAQAVGAIATNSLLQRCAPSASVGQAFAVREALFCLGLAAGSILAPVLVAAFGVGGAFVVVGALLPVVVLVRLGTVWRLDRAATVPIVELSLLGRLTIFGRLPAPALEGLARNATPVAFADGAELMRQGEPGARYLAIADGSVEIVRDGTVVAVRSRGEGVGETALLRDVPRTATVRAVGPVHTLSIDKGEFLIAVTGHAATHATAMDIAQRRIADDPGAD
jgi:predicted MFS family arabinose efflux permease